MKNWPRFPPPSNDLDRAAAHKSAAYSAPLRKHSATELHNRNTGWNLLIVAIIAFAVLAARNHW